jgi:pyrroloquinoline quinone biosynthesis protein E
MIANPDVSELGDATDFAAVWKSDAYREFRQAHLDGNIPKECGGCYLKGSSAKSQTEPQILQVEV